MCMLWLGAHWLHSLDGCCIFGALLPVAFGSVLHSSVPKSLLDALPATRLVRPIAHRNTAVLRARAICTCCRKPEVISGPVYLCCIDRIVHVITACHR